MKYEWLWCTKFWCKCGLCQDCVLVEVDHDEALKGLHVAQLCLLLNLQFDKQVFSCALIHWFPDLQSNVDPVTGVRLVVPAVNTDGSPKLALVHIDSIV
jgi:hypothetical protein